MIESARPVRSRPAPAPERLAHGTAAVLVAEALALPTGLVTAGVLTRALGPGDYGLLTLTATIVGWIEWTLTSMLARPTIRFVSQSHDKEAIASVVVWLHAVLGATGLVLVVLLSEPAARWLGEASLAPYLRLFALDVIVFALAQAHRNVLVGLGRYTARAWATAGRWVARLVVIVVLVAAGFGIAGAIWGSIAASLTELAIARRHVRTPIRWRVHLDLRPWIAYAAPLSLAAISIRLFDKLDLLMLKGLGATAADAGLYGAAQNLSTVPGIFALSFSPLLLAAIGRALHAGDREAAHRSAREALRLAICLAPLLAVAMVSSRELTSFVFGRRFEAAGDVLAILLAAALALLVISVATAVLVAFDEPGRVAWVTAPLVPAAAIGHLLVIPRFGPSGAAIVTALTAGGAAVVSLAIVHAGWHVLPRPVTWIRAALISILVLIAGPVLPVQGVTVLLKLTCLSLAVCALYVVLGEVSIREIGHVLRRGGPSAAGRRRAG